LSEELPKNGDVPKSSLFQSAAKVPIGRHILKYRPLVLTSGAIGIRTYACPRSGPGVLGHRPHQRSIEEERRMQVLVRDNNVDQALKVLKKKMQREGGSSVR
jgi:hypothetical protein